MNFSLEEIGRMINFLEDRIDVEELNKKDQCSLKNLFSLLNNLENTQEEFLNLEQHVEILEEEIATLEDELTYKNDN